MINIGAIKNISRVKKCSRGSIITGEGLTTIMFIILKGEVGVYTDYRLPGAEMIATLGAGELFADAGLLQDKRASYTTTALSEAMIMPIKRSSFSEFLQDEPSLAFEIIKDLYLRLEQFGTSYKEPLVDNQHGRDENHQPLEPEAAPAAESVYSDENFRLFPEEHGCYKLLLNNDDTMHLMNKSHNCPICKRDFMTLAVRPSKLVLASTDDDMRNRYKGIEPLYYEVLTCPRCLYSASPDVFDIPDKSKQDIMHRLETIKDSIVIGHGAKRDTASVFAGFYLALFCAPFCFSNYQLVAGKLLYKLSRIYQDAGDKNMETETTRKALDNYLYAYENIGIPTAQEPQIYILIGELYLKLGDLKNAITFFFKAKTSSNSSPVLKNHADNRVYDIRELAAAHR